MNLWNDVLLDLPNYNENVIATNGDTVFIACLKEGAGMRDLWWNNGRIVEVEVKYWIALPRIPK
jgi:hypothetical protein